MQLQVVTTSVRKFIRELKAMLKSGDAETDEKEKFRLLTTAQLAPSSLCYELNNILKYAYCEAKED